MLIFCEISVSYTDQPPWNATCSFQDVTEYIRLEVRNEPFEVTARARSIDASADCAAGLCTEHRHQFAVSRAELPAELAY